jgi:hypothetical protein
MAFMAWAPPCIQDVANPETYLPKVLERFADQGVNRIDELDAA